MTQSLRCLAVIPCRLTSTRLPAKPLKDIAGKSLIQRVWEQASRAETLTKVIIATDSQEIFNATRNFGAECIMTGSDNVTGSDRVAEAYSILRKQGQDFDLVANVQGDMPFINPKVIDKAVRTLSEASPQFGMSTIATPITDHEEFLRPSAVKAVLGENNLVLYFSRSPVPFLREPEHFKVSEADPYGYKHMGLYVFRPATLLQMKSLPQATVECHEKLEQLRLVAHGIKIKLTVVTREEVSPAIEVDTPADLEAAIHAAQIGNN